VKQQYWLYVSMQRQRNQVASVRLYPVQLPEQRIDGVMFQPSTKYLRIEECQRASGGPFSSFVIVPTEAFKLTKGSPRFHDSPSEAGGKTHRGFCADCGSQIVVHADANA